MTDSAESTRRVAFHTLGCKLNFAETSTIALQLQKYGWVTATGAEEPDLCVINTCSVTEMADKKCRHLIRRLHSLHPRALIIVTGCFAQLKPDDVAAIPGVSLVLGQDRKAEIATRAEELLAARPAAPLINVADFRSLRGFTPACGRGERTRYWLKVQDGCDYWCSYCTIPMARGRSRSATIDQCVEQARLCAEAGGREIVLTGVNVGEFGRERGEDLLSLLRALDAVEGISRYRISSIEPNLLTPAIIEFVAGSRAFMPHFHVPLQSGSDAVLSLMRRRYDTALFASRMQLIRSLIPRAFIGVDVIAGARGESLQEWERSKEFIASLPVTQLHVFPYSERPGTRALQLDGAVEQQEKHRRVAELIALSEQKYEDFRLRNIGSLQSVLWEQPHHDQATMTGLTGNYLRVEAPLDPSLIGGISTVRINACKDAETLSCSIIK